MYIIKEMSEQLRKLNRLSRTCFDITLSPGETGCTRIRNRYLKMLLDGSCSFDCAYCGVCQNENPVSFSPEEFAPLILKVWRNHWIDGLFLSTGIPRDTEASMEDLLQTAHLLRQGGFTGYLHLKVVPGALRGDIAEAARLADRISINLEATDKSRLSEIASVKNYESDLLRRHAWVFEAAPDRHTTQIVVGAAEETDAEILSFMDREYQRYAPARIYYSGLIPLPQTPLAASAPASPARIRGLYAVDALVRTYGYSLHEVRGALGEEGMLLAGDPKINCSGSKPIDPLSASREELIRVPGIGPKAVDRILAMRREGVVISHDSLKEMGVILKRALPHLRIDGSIQSRLPSLTYTPALSTDISHHPRP
ncbi:radical SAM protein [Methanocalculus sp.]|uniref:radical SAM protein n=1 Tax=Methanocalculus sp. TaxID=2004547 RepID=UPI002727A81A|nr:radical SAM protein [Methanocalculus sp.]MDO8840853.1 radical SAM protein [Methanocalculus sp.]